MDDQNRGHKIRVYALLVVITIAIYYVLDLDWFSGWTDYLPFIKKLTVSLTAIFIVLLVTKIIEKIIAGQGLVEGDRYNLLRIVRLITIAFIFIIVASFLFQKPYASLASLGLISLVLSFSLQSPITSFIGWLYVVFRRPYKVGDRIQINQHRGDVVEISYLDTIILECSGDYLGNDRRSGRVIHFPNSLILKDKVINYSGPQVPFIWNETPVQVSYTSDLPFVEECLIRAAVEDFKERYPMMYEGNSKKWEPAVYFRVNQYAWMEAVISYPVEPVDTTGRRNRILRNALPLLNAQPGKVQFPEGVRR